MVPVEALDSVATIDNLLRQAQVVPEDERTDAWHRMVDALLERRARLAGTEAQRCERR